MEDSSENKTKDVKANGQTDDQIKSEDVSANYQNDANAKGDGRWMNNYVKVLTQHWEHLIENSESNLDHLHKVDADHSEPEMKDPTTDSTKNEEPIEVKLKTDAQESTAVSDVTNIDSRSEMSFAFGDFGDAFAPIASVEDFSTLSLLETETNSYTNLGNVEKTLMSSTETLKSHDGDEHLAEAVVPNKSDAEVNIEVVSSEAKDTEYEESAIMETSTETSPLASDKLEVDANQFDEKDMIEERKIKGKTFGKKMKEMLKIKTPKQPRKAKIDYPSSPTLHNRHEDIAQNSSMNHDKEVEHLEQALADTGKK